MAIAGDNWSGRVAEAIAAVNRPGAYCASGTAADTPPGLDVDGIGPIGLPLSLDQATRLKRQCEQAPYGKGEQTVVDTSVRRVWRLTADRFVLANPAWPAAIQQIVADVQKDLGLEDRDLQPHLHDLLLYEPGGFFLPHRDGEKLDRMVATLIVMLPSHYTGGELIVRHEGQERVIDLGGEPSRFKTQYAAFYADCEHEVKTVTAGHRLCLVYNLTLAKSKRAIGAPTRGEHVRRVTQLLADWTSIDDAPHKLAVTLEHQYTQDGLAWDALKGVDRARADVLAASAAAAGCFAYLALVTLWEVGTSEGGYDDYYEYGEDGDDEEDGGNQGGEHEMGDVIDTSLTADGWRAPDGTAMPFGPLPVDEPEVSPAGSLQTAKPEEAYEGYTGNAGMTLERWYRRAAVILWPESRHVDVLVDAGAREAVPALLQLAESARHADAPRAAALREQCRLFAEMVLKRWPKNPFRTRPRADRKSVDPLPCLDFLDDVPLLRMYLRDTLPKDVGLQPGGALPAVLSRHGWPTFAPDLAALFRQTEAESLDRNALLLDRLCRAGARLRDPAARREARSACRRLARIVVAALINIDRALAALPVDRGRRAATAGAGLARLTRALLLVRHERVLAQLVDHLIATPDLYPLQAVQMASLTRLGRWLDDRPKRRRSPALARWVADVRRRLESLTAAVPQPPADQRRDATVKCDCADCAALNRFLADPAERQHPFKMAQPRRDHLEDQINKFRCDLDRQTDRRPRPQVLICTKNAATYQRLLKEHHQNLAHLAELKSLEATG